MDVAISGGKIARVAASIPASAAGKVVGVDGLYVTPGLIDIHAHLYIRGNPKELERGENNVQADAFSFRSGVTTMSIILNLGQSMDTVIRMSTVNPAKEIKCPQLGNLDVGSEADVAILRVDRGRYGFLDSAGARNEGTQAIVCEMTIRKGAVVWDLNGRASQDWKSFRYQKKAWTH